MATLTCGDNQIKSSDPGNHPGQKIAIWIFGSGSPLPNTSTLQAQALADAHQKVQTLLAGIHCPDKCKTMTVLRVGYTTHPVSVTSIPSQPPITKPTLEFSAQCDWIVEVSCKGLATMLIDIQHLIDLLQGLP